MTWTCASRPSLMLALAIGVASPCAAHADEARPPVVGGPQIAGGWSKGSPDDGAVQQAALFAAGQLPGKARLAKVQRVQQQVVAGMNYRIELTLSDGSLWEVTIYRHFSGAMQLTNSVRLSPVAEAKLALAGNGLTLAMPRGAAHTIAFGTRHDHVMRALRFRSEPGTSTNSECGAGPIQFASWPDGLNLLFQNGKFQGWSLDARADTLKTTHGLRIGATRLALQKLGRLRVSRTSLGTEFTMGGVSGVLSNPSPRGRVEALWAGLSCNFR